MAKPKEDRCKPTPEEIESRIGQLDLCPNSYYKAMTKYESEVKYLGVIEIPTNLQIRDLIRSIQSEEDIWCS